MGEHTMRVEDPEGKIWIWHFEPFPGPGCTLYRTSLEIPCGVRIKWRRQVKHWREAHAFARRWNTAIRTGASVSFLHDFIV